MEGLRRAWLSFLHSLGLRQRPTRSGIEYWEERAQRHGARSVLDTRHVPEEMAAVTRRQQDILLPLLTRELTREDRIVLDFGCGPGRFTPALAEATTGHAIGVDPIQHLLDLAPRDERVEYRRMPGGAIPVEDASIDVVWTCLVLTTIVDEEVLKQSVREIERVLRPGGLLFLVENTSRKRDRAHVSFRSEKFYRSLFPAVHLRRVDEYEDCGERISVFTGRKRG